ncbi:MAG TPA: hypothetical protein VMT69_17725 [Kineosporiaceae bacterium]|nr:hypothetical protein [Kineosporiaceae bacterium]
MDGADPNPAGYSGSPLHRKLGVKPGARVLVVAAPPEFDLGLLAPPDLDVELVTVGGEEPTGTACGHEGRRRTLEPPAGVLLIFCPDSARLVARLPSGMALTAPGGRCWVAWPKRASGVPTDLTEDVVRAAALAVGWVDVKVAAVDRIWSGLCLMRRTSGPSTSGV